MKAISPILSVLPGYGIRVLIAYILERHASYLSMRWPVLLPAYKSSHGFISSLYTLFRVFASLNLYFYHFVGGSRIKCSWKRYRRTALQVHLFALPKTDCPYALEGRRTFRDLDTMQGCGNYS